MIDQIPIINYHSDAVVTQSLLTPEVCGSNPGPYVG